MRFGGLLNRFFPLLFWSEGWETSGFPKAVPSPLPSSTRLPSGEPEVRLRSRQTHSTPTGGSRRLPDSVSLSVQWGEDGHLRER